MEKKIILITGTSSGFGWLAAKTCAAAGHKVYAMMRETNGKNSEKAKALNQIENITVLDVDVRNGNSISEAIHAIIQSEGRLDVLVNNAAVYATGIAETYSEMDFSAVLDVNVTGAWRAIKAAMPQLRKQQEGLIINISSVAGRFSFPFQTVYNTAKFALEGLTEGLHYEVRSLGVDVVMIQPGPFPTEVWSKTVSGSDPSVAEGYGQLTEIPAQIGAGIAHLFETVKPDPQMVADVILDLIHAPRGQRPLRTVVDPATGIFTETANKSVQEQYEQFLTAFGLKELLI